MLVINFRKFGGMLLKYQPIPTIVCLYIQCAYAKSLQLCSTLCDTMDRSLPGSSVHGILQARMLEWGAISFSRGSSDPGIKPMSPTLASRFFTTEPPGKASASKAMSRRMLISLKTNFSSTWWGEVSFYVVQNT